MHNVQYRSLVLLISILALASLPSCSLFQKIAQSAQPEFHVRDVSVKNVTLENISFHVDSELVNRLPVPIPSSVLKLDILINGRKLSSMQSAPVSVPASGSVPVPVDVSLKFTDIASIVKSMSLVESFKLGLQGSIDFRIDVPGLPPSISVPFRVEKTVPSFVPEVTVDSIQLRHPDLGSLMGAFLKDEIKLGLDLSVTVKNRGGSKLTVRDLGYSLSLEDRELFNGQTTAATAGADGKSSTLRISTDVSVREGIKSLISLLQKRAIPYALKGNMRIDFPGLDLNQIQLPLNKDGRINL